jgi:hypothetical protein
VKESGLEMTKAGAICSVSVGESLFVIKADNNQVFPWQSLRQFVMAMAEGG